MPDVAMTTETSPGAITTAPCDYCGKGFEPRIKQGPNKSRFCCDTCRNRYHLEKGMSAIICNIESVRTRASTQEALLTLAVPIEQGALIAGFMAKIGKQVGVAFADVEQSKDYGHEAAGLRKSGFFRIPQVWKAIGTDDEFRAWIQRQPSAISGDFSEYVDGEGRNIAAHVRRAGESGAGYKAPYACIPLTNAEHQNQHQVGESALGGKEWCDKMRIKYVEQWAWDTLKAQLGRAHWSDVPPETLREWARMHDVIHHLPALYR